MITDIKNLKRGDLIILCTDNTLVQGFVWNAKVETDYYSFVSYIALSNYSLQSNHKYSITGSTTKYRVKKLPVSALNEEEKLLYDKICEKYKFNNNEEMD